jgi:dienelactone hydrolase
VGLTVRQASDADQKICISKQNLDYGRRLAQHGFMVFAPEQRGFGQRIDSIPDITVENTPGHNSCRALAFNAMLLGKTAIGLRVWDVMRTIDYIRSRQEPMIEEIGCLGFSGGGTTTLFASALDLRITVAVVSGYFNTFHASIMSHYHCECNYIPSILQYAEMSDIAGLIAPRFLLIESGVDDPIYPVEAAEAAFHELQRVYALLKVSNRLEHEVFPGGHQFGGNRCFAWLDEWLE